MLVLPTASTWVPVLESNWSVLLTEQWFSHTSHPKTQCKLKDKVHRENMQSISLHLFSAKSPNSHCDKLSWHADHYVVKCFLKCPFRSLEVGGQEAERLFPKMCVRRIKPPLSHSRRGPRKPQKVDHQKCVSRTIIFSPEQDFLAKRSKLFTFPFKMQKSAVSIPFSSSDENQLILWSQMAWRCYISFPK